MDGTKKWWESRGIWGGVAAAIVGLGGILGWTFAEGDAATMTDLIMGIVAGVGGLLAIWGRRDADKKIV